VALAIDGSTPAVVTAATKTLTTASFTPPAGALLLALWAANSTASTNPGAPAITDNLGVHLTYTRNDWQSRANSPTVDGQAADWTAVVGSSAAQTVTTTNGVSASEFHQALAVMVITGQHATPVGAHGQSGSTSASSVAQSFTATATNSWGFIAVCDWDAKGSMTAGTGCTLIGTGTIPTTQISYGIFRRTTADGVNGGTTTMNVNLAGTSTHVSWAYVEIVPAAGGSTVNGTASVAGAGALTAVVVESVTATLAGAGSVTAPVVESVRGSFAGAGALTSPAVQGSSTTPVGGGTVSALVTESVAASIAGAGVLAAAVTQLGATSPAGAGTLTAPAVQSVTATPTGAGALAASATVTGGTVNGAAALVGAGVLSAPATQAARSSPAGAGALAAAGVITGAASLAATGALLAAVVQSVVSSATGAGALVAAGSVSGASCSTPRPSSGLTARPGSGSTTRPNTGVTNDPC
jgi:hypothetical protein